MLVVVVAEETRGELSIPSSASFAARRSAFLRSFRATSLFCRASRSACRFLADVPSGLSALRLERRAMMWAVRRARASARSAAVTGGLGGGEGVVGVVEGEGEVLDEFEDVGSVVGRSGVSGGGFEGDFGGLGGCSLGFVGAFAFAFFCDDGLGSSFFFSVGASTSASALPSLSPFPEAVSRVLPSVCFCFGVAFAFRFFFCSSCFVGEDSSLVKGAAFCPSSFLFSFFPSFRTFFLFAVGSSFAFLASFRFSSLVSFLLFCHTPGTVS